MTSSPLIFTEKDLKQWPWQNLPEPVCKLGTESDTRWPKISIITPSYNQAEYIEETIRSVLLQGYPNLEYFVIDGGSTDGTVEIVKRYEKWISGWVSKLDSGQSDAIQKGIDMSSGIIVNWLNSDDMLLPGALFSVAEAFNETTADIIVGRDWDFRVSIATPEFHFIPTGYAYPDCLRFWTGEFRYHQPCTFFTREVYEKAGGIDKTLYYAMDYALYCRMLKTAGVKITYMKQEISAFRLHEQSKTSSQQLGFIQEMRTISIQHWSDIRIDNKTSQHEMDKYTVRCLVHQMIQIIRQRKFSELSKVLEFIWHTGVGHALIYATSSIIKKILKRKEIAYKRFVN
jgi:GT2 family glycosyltransferase